MTTPRTSPFADLLPMLGRRGRALDLAWRTAPPDERTELEVVAEVMRLRATSDRSVLLRPPEHNQADGPVRIGQILHGKQQLGWLGVTHDELCQHMTVCGRSGSGKSNTCLQIMLQLHEAQVPWLIFDYKRSARALRAMPGRQDIHILTLGRDIAATLRFNPLVPLTGSPVDSHIRWLSEAVAREWFAGDGVIALLERCLRTCYEAAAPNWPTLRDVAELAEQQHWKGREAQWGQSLQRILQQLTHGQLGSILCDRSDAVALDQLLEHYTVVELDGLATPDANFIVNYLTRFLTASLLQRDAREELKFAVLVEEAQHLLGRTEGNAARPSPLEIAIREAREIGLGFLIAAQSPSMLSQTVLANTYTAVMMNCRHRADVTAAAGSLLLTDDQRELLSVLPTGEAVARISGRYPYPVHIRVPPLDLPKGAVRDADIAHAFLEGPYCRMVLDQLPGARPATGSAKSTDSSPVHASAPPAAELSPLPPPDKTDTTTDSNPTTRPPSPEDSTPPEMQDTGPPNLIDQDPDLALMLRSVAHAPLLGTAARCDQLQLSRRRGVAIKDALIELGYVRSVDVPIPEGKTVLLELLEPGRRWLARHHVQAQPLHGSLPHAYWQDRLAASLHDRGWAVTTEHSLGGTRVDVFAEREGLTIAVEVETGKSAWMDNLHRLGKSKVTHKAVLWLDRSRQLQVTPHVPVGVELLTTRSVGTWLNKVAP